jgi:hypothetical protein
LLRLTNQLKKKLLLSDFSQINQEVIQGQIERSQSVEDEAARVVALLAEIQATLK